ncbi:MAG: hypothetical protein JO115_04625 [Pseudonocardiales bacterium]|nr:hypothetical protein [Pseudonocardiales bacterium]
MWAWPRRLDPVLVGTPVQEIEGHTIETILATSDLKLSVRVAPGPKSGKGHSVGKHEDKHKDEQERKRQSNGQVPPGTRISPKEPRGKHSAPEPDEPEKDEK